MAFYMSIFGGSRGDGAVQGSRSRFTAHPDLEVLLLDGWAERVVLPRAAPARMMKSLCTAEHKCVKTLRWNASPRHRLTGYSAVLAALFWEGRAHGSWFCHHDLCAVLLIMSKRHRTMNAQQRLLDTEIYLHGGIYLLGRTVGALGTLLFAS